MAIIIVVDNMLEPWEPLEQEKPGESIPQTIYNSLNNDSEYRYNDRFFVILNDRDRKKNSERCQEVMDQHSNATFEISYHEGCNPPDKCALAADFIENLRQNKKVEICSFHHQNNDDVWNIIVKKCTEIENAIQE